MSYPITTIGRIGAAEPAPAPAPQPGPLSRWKEEITELPNLVGRAFMVAPVAATVYTAAAIGLGALGMWLLTRRR